MNPFLNPEKWPPLGEPLGPPDVLDEYCRTYERTGFRGGINWYRNIDRNAAEHPDGRHAPPRAALPDADGGAGPGAASGVRRADMRALCSDLELHHVEKVGHWVQQEAPDVVNGASARVAAPLREVIRLPVPRHWTFMLADSIKTGPRCSPHFSSGASGRPHRSQLRSSPRCSAAGSCWPGAATRPPLPRATSPDSSRSRRTGRCTSSVAAPGRRRSFSSPADSRPAGSGTTRSTRPTRCTRSRSMGSRPAAAIRRSSRRPCSPGQQADARLHLRPTQHHARCGHPARASRRDLHPGAAAAFRRARRRGSARLAGRCR